MSGLDVRLERLLATTPETAFHHRVDPGERRLPTAGTADRTTDRTTDEGEVR